MSSIEKELDEIFLKSMDFTFDNKKLENLKEFSKNMHTINPYLDLLLEKLSSIKIHFNIYNLQLESLATQISDIQDRNKELEEKYNKEKTIFDCLKGLTMALNIDDKHLQILDKGNFTNLEELVKMQESLDILSGFEADKFNIRVANEMKRKILTCQRNFYKRFATFFTSVFIKSEGFGDLKVHKDLYNTTNKFKFIFIRSKMFKDCFQEILFTYVSNSKAIYKQEFINHLNGINKLIDDPGKLHISIEVLFKSYLSICNVELNFLRNLLEDNDEAEKTTLQIFDEIEALLLEFIEKMFRKSELVTIISISPFTELQAQSKPLLKFIAVLTEKTKILKEMFIKNEEERLIKTIKIGNLQQLLIQDNLNDLKIKMLNIYLDRLMKRIDSFDLQKLLNRYKLICSLKIPKDLNMDYLQIESLNKLFSKIENLVIEFVFNSKNEISKAKEVVQMIKERSEGITECESILLKKIRAILIENCDDSMKEEMKKVFS
ncbi:hypothetical protein NUSPORA_00465 [Nucleospora cyclopteri]